MLEDGQVGLVAGQRDRGDVHQPLGAVVVQHLQAGGHQIISTLLLEHSSDNTHLITEQTGKRVLRKGLAGGDAELNINHC